MSGALTRPLRAQHGSTLVELALTLALFGLIVLGVVATWTKAQQVFFVGSELAEVQENIRAAIDFIGRELRTVGRDVTSCAFDYTGPVSRDCSGTKVMTCAKKLNRNNPPNGTFYSGLRGCANVFAIPAATATRSTIRIRADRNDNGTIARAGASPADTGAEDVAYELKSTSPPCPPGVRACITRDDGAGPQALVAVDVTAFQLTYHPRPGFGPCSGNPPPTPCPAYTLPLTQAQADNIGRIAVVITAVQKTAGQEVSRTVTTDIVLRNRM